MSDVSEKAYTRLALAYKNNKGLRLSAQEVHALVNCDDAIEQVVNQIIYGPSVARD